MVGKLLSYYEVIATVAPVLRGTGIKVVVIVLRLHRRSELPKLLLERGYILVKAYLSIYYTMSPSEASPCFRWKVGVNVTPPVILAVLRSFFITGQGSGRQLVPIVQTGQMWAKSAVVLELLSLYYYLLRGSRCYFFLWWFRNGHGTIGRTCCPSHRGLYRNTFYSRPMEGDL